jgi:hypothetical protein
VGAIAGLGLCEEHGVLVHFRPACRRRRSL